MFRFFAFAILFAAFFAVLPTKADDTWREYLDQPFVGTATKILRKSELAVFPSRSESIFGIAAIKQVFGDQKQTFFTIFINAEKPSTVSTAFTTWFYRNRLNQPYWSLYMPITRAKSNVKPGDLAFIGLRPDRTVVIVFAPKGGEAAQFIRDRYGISPLNVSLKDDDAPPAISQTLPPKAQVRAPYSFSQAKKLLNQEIYTTPSERKTMYCGCNYAADGAIDPLSCGYQPRRAGSKRSSQVEWEHIVPASYIGKGRACWIEGNAECVTKSGKTYKGRQCCNKVDDQFRRTMADLNNLAPAIGEINADRSNYPHREIEGEERLYGSCDFEVDFKAREAEPAIPLRGFIGRTWLYMHNVHSVQLTRDDLTVYQAWVEAYPPDQWELDRKNRITEALE